jgi:hypothetical protein
MAPQYHVLFTRSTAKCGKYAVSVLPAGFSRLPSGLGSFLGYSGSLFGGEDFSPGLPTLQPSQPSKGNSGRVLCGWVLLLVGGGSVVGVMGWFAGPVTALRISKAVTLTSVDLLVFAMLPLPDVEKYLKVLMVIETESISRSVSGLPYCKYCSTRVLAVMKLATNRWGLGSAVMPQHT